MNLDKAGVVSVHKSAEHTFSKYTCDYIELLAGEGVLRDAHCGTTVKHRSRVTKDPYQPNLRQLHLIHAELFDELHEKGFTVNPGDLGENVTTRNIPLLELPTNTLLYIGDDVVVKLTGLRNPCNQIDTFMPGLQSAVLDHDSEGNIIRKCGVMAVILVGRVVKADDSITIELPDRPHIPLQRV